MSQLLGIVSVDTVAFDRSLVSAPPGFASLLMAEAHGWGAAVYDGVWSLERRALGSASEEGAAAIARRMRGNVLVAHVRARSDPEVAPENMQPFERDGWVFAHEGAIDEPDDLRPRISRERLRECRGHTVSELLFAYLLTCFDEERAHGGSEPNAMVTNVVRKLVDRRIGATNFLLSNGSLFYAHRLGRPLHLVDSKPGRSLTIASYPLTNESWLTLDEGALLACKRGAELEVIALLGTDPRPPKSDVELPFTD